MIGLLALILTSIVLLVATRAYAGAYGHTPTLGSMSEQWLAENRASHQ